MSLGKNTAWNVAGNAVPLLLGAVTIPILIPELGLERFGILTLLWAVIGYFSLFDFGIGRAVTQQVAASLGAGQTENIQRVVKAGLEFTVLTGLVGAAILIVASYPLAYLALGISDSLKHEVFVCFAIAAIGIPLATFGNGLRGALEGYEQFHISNYARMLLGGAIFLFPYLAVTIHGPSLIPVTIWLVGARLINCILSLWFVIKLPSGAFWKAEVNQETRRKLFAFGSWMAVTNIVSPILVNADRFFIANILGAGMVAYYTVPFEFLVRLLILPGALGATLLPLMARSRNVNILEFDKAYSSGIKIISVVMFVVVVLACLVSLPLMEFFISKDFAAKSWNLVLILAIGVFFNSLAYIPYTAIHAMGSAKKTGLLHLGELIVYLPALMLLVGEFQLTGAAIAWTARTFIDAIALHLLLLTERKKHV